MKTVSGMASSDQVNLLLIESSMLKDLTHKNLLPVMAVCLEDEKQPLIMFPFMNRGNLKLFIKKSRSPEGGSKVRQKADEVPLPNLFAAYVATVPFAPRKKEKAWPHRQVWLQEFAKLIALARKGTCCAIQNSLLFMRNGA